VASEMAYECDGRSFCGYLADGSRGAAAPGVLVIHEASGLGPHARSRADMLASLGYVAFAPDIFGGPARTLDEAAAYIGELSGDVEKLRRRCGAALDNLRALSCVDSQNLAAIGFCFGGQAALELARSGCQLRATVGFHSGLKASDPAETSRIQGRVREARDTFMDDLTDNGVDGQMLLFSGVGHSFTNADAEAFGVPGCHYNEVADKRSWRAMQNLFTEVFAGYCQIDGA
jgi:dienelactone hydrolase